MRKGLVSVVLPVYNVEQYLDRCMESVVNQTYRNLEIILVDDGSTDSCPRKCDEWAARDSRIKVIHKESAGAGMARNTGMDHVTGEYICFFDSDDYVALDTIEKAYQCISSHHAEIVLFGYYTVDSNGKIKKTDIPKTEKLLYQGDEIKSYVLPNIIGADPKTGRRISFTISVWSCMYSMAAIRRSHWRFVSERQYISEDSYSLLFLYKDITCVAVLPEALYFYCENKASFSRGYQKDRYEKIKFWYDACIGACNELGYGSQVINRMPDLFLGFTIGAMKIIVRADCSRREKKAEIDTILRDRKLYEVISEMNIKFQSKQRKPLMISIKYRFYRLARWMIMAKAAHEKSGK